MLKHFGTRRGAIGIAEPSAIVDVSGNSGCSLGKAATYPAARQARRRPRQRQKNVAGAICARTPTGTAVKSAKAQNNTA